ncbi:hypothetical protein [Hoeflea sp.]|uniref:hypothetical protein n=1 Tax=Hoeflea sp. TaxID=1940281 RepID=UPI00374984FE
MNKRSIINKEEIPEFHSKGFSIATKTLIYSVAITLLIAFVDNSVIALIHKTPFNKIFLIDIFHLRRDGLNEAQAFLGDRFLVAFILVSLNWSVHIFKIANIVIYNWKTEYNYFEKAHHKWLLLVTISGPVVVYSFFYADWTPADPNYPGGLTYLNTKYALFMLPFIVGYCAAITVGCLIYIMRLLKIKG